MKTLKNLLLATALLALATSAFASTLVTIDFTTLPGQTANGYYVGYSEANITTASNVTFSNFDLICDDFGHTTNIPSGPFTYAVSTLPSLTDVRFTQSPELKNYEIAAVLVYEFDQNLGTVDQGGYNFALWHLFSPGLTGNFGDSAALITQATNIVNSNSVSNVAIQNAAYKDLNIFTPVGDSKGNQEFLAITSSTFGTPNSPVPEPATFFLMGTALIGIGFVRRKTRKA